MDEFMMPIQLGAFKTNQISLGTGGAIDLLEREEYANLKQLLADPVLAGFASNG